MSNLRRLSRSAYPEAWARVTYARRLRRLTGRALRAEGRGDRRVLDRASELIRRLTGVSEEIRTQGVKPDVAPPTLIQRGKAGIAKMFRTMRGDR